MRSSATIVIRDSSASQSAMKRVDAQPSCIAKPNLQSGGTRWADRESRNYPEEIRQEKFEEMLTSRANIEAKYGCEELWKAIGSGHDEAWQCGYISGKRATLRWVLGSDWDFLDT